MIRAGIVLGLGALAFLPLVELLDNSVDAPPWDAAVKRWIAGIALTLPLALLAALVSVPERWQQKLAATEAAVSGQRLATAALVGAVATACFGLLAFLLFDAVPIYIDELAQAQQARIFVARRLWLGVPEPAAAFSSFQMVEVAGRTFSQYTPGWPAALALGELVGLRWLAGPLLGGLAVAVLFLLALQLGERPRVAVAAAALLVVSPWFYLNAASHMNHTATTALVALGMLLLVRLYGHGQSSPPRAAMAGLAFGLAGSVRPADALAFAIPAGVWLLLRSVRRQQFSELAAFIGGGLVPTSLVLAFNAATTGDPLTFGLVAQWGAGHELGFHDAPWGPRHTPLRGLAVLNSYLRLMQRTALESPVPALLPALAALLLVRRVQAADRYVLGSGALLLLVYFSYWGVSDEWIGPRFLLPLAPILMLWIARLPGAVAVRIASPVAGRAAAAWLALVVLSGIPGMVAVAQQYAGEYPARRFRADVLAGRQGIENSLVLVPDSWANELAARIWARGVSRSDARRMVRESDRCLLQRELIAIEHDEISGPEATSRLAAVPNLAPATWAELVGPTQPRLCRERRIEERQGSWSLLPYLLARRHGNVYARDIHERLEPLLEAFAGRAVYVARPHPELGLAEPVFVPFDADSARRAWYRRLRAGW